MPSTLETRPIPNTKTAEERADFYRTKMEVEWGPYDVKRAMDDNRVIVVDTRDPESFAKEHIPKAINIPTDDLPKRLNELPQDKEIVPYCWTIVCHLATRAALYLSEQGYRVHELAGGIEYWKNYQMPLEKSQA
jgi:rhodanese-related sulfurtransferase